MAIIRGTTSGRRTVVAPKPKPAPNPAKMSPVPTKRMPQAQATNRSYGPGPITVHTSKPASPSTTRSAIRRWNTQAGFTVFKATPNAKKADVKVRAAPKLRRAWATGQRGRVNVASSAARLARTPIASNTKATLARVYQHELGHTVGLAHPGPKRDPYMASSATRQRQGGIMGSGRRATTNDVDAIKALRKSVNAYRKLAAGKGKFKGR